MNEALRFETTAVLQPVYSRAVKMVAANRPPYGVSDKRVYRELEGDDANRLELLCQDLDRIVVEKGHEAVAPVIAFLAARYSPSTTTPTELVHALADAVIVGGAAEAELLRAMPGGIDDIERRRALGKLYQWRERVGHLIHAVESEKGSIS